MEYPHMLPLYILDSYTCSYILPLCTLDTLMFHSTYLHMVSWPPPENLHIPPHSRLYKIHNCSYILPPCTLHKLICCSKPFHMLLAAQDPDIPHFYILDKIHNRSYIVHQHTLRKNWSLFHNKSLHHIVCIL